MLIKVNGPPNANILTKNAVYTMCKQYENDIILSERLIVQLIKVDKYPSHNTNTHHVSLFIIVFIVFILIQML